MFNKFKVKKKLVSIALALALGAQPLASLPMNVFAGTGKTGVYTLNGLKIKNIPSKKVWFFKSGAEICNLKLEGVPSGKTVVWSVIQGEDIATVDSNGVVKAKGTKGGKVSVLAKCDGMLTGCSFEIGYFDTKKFASDLLKDITAMTENSKLVDRAGKEYEEYLNSLKAIVEQFSKLPDDQIANFSDEKSLEIPTLEIQKLSAEQFDKLSAEDLLKFEEGQSFKAISVEYSEDVDVQKRIGEMDKLLLEGIFGAGGVWEEDSVASLMAKGCASLVSILSFFCLDPLYKITEGIDGYRSNPTFAVLSQNELRVFALLSDKEKLMSYIYLDFMGDASYSYINDLKILLDNPEKKLLGNYFFIEFLHYLASDLHSELLAGHINANGISSGGVERDDAGLKVLCEKYIKCSYLARNAAYDLTVTGSYARDHNAIPIVHLIRGLYKTLAFFCLMSDQEDEASKYEACANQLL